MQIILFFIFSSIYVMVGFLLSLIYIPLAGGGDIGLGIIYLPVVLFSLLAAYFFDKNKKLFFGLFFYFTLPIILNFLSIAAKNLGMIEIGNFLFSVRYFALFFVFIIILFVVGVIHQKN